MQNMKLIIDEKQCTKHHLTIPEVLLVLSIRNTQNFKASFDNLVDREVLVFKDSDYYVTSHWSDEVDELLADSMSETDDEERLLNLAKKMRDAYPKGKMPGTAYYYSCNNREVILKLKKFFQLYGNYADDKILEAEKRFVASFNGNYKYLPLIKYFISKDKLKLGEDGQQHVSPESPLATYLENKEDTDLVTASDDWLSSVRN